MTRVHDTIEVTMSFNEKKKKIGDIYAQHERYDREI